MKLAVVGAGKMGGAVVRGAMRAGLLEVGDVGIYHPDPKRRASACATYDAVPLDEEALRGATRVLIAVKPQVFEAVAPLIARSDATFVSLMAGITTATLADRLGSRYVVRAMPNLGAAVGASATAMCSHEETPPEEIDVARRLFEAIGLVHEIPERLFDAYTGLAGSGPAYVGVIAEAFADGGVRVGLSRSVARDLARQVLLGSAQLLEDKHAAVLKDEVASPGGTAIAGVRALERHGVRFAVMDAIEEATNRARALARGDH